MRVAAMIKPDGSIEGIAQMLRRDFDRSFAEAPPEAPRLESMLAVRIAGDAHAIRLAEIGGLYVDRRIVPLPTPVPDLLGFASFRGQVAPVYDLAALLGYASRGAPRWLVLVAGRDTAALAFELFETQLMISPERDIVPTGVGNESANRACLRGAVQAEGLVRPIVHLPSVVDEIRKRVEATLLTKER
jgi:purine-binding chemotaxis protein CheW